MYATDNQGRVSFGVFEADPESGELWKAGRKVRLQTQPFKVLQVLIEHAGEVVSREELQHRVWDPGTNVDFDRALAGAINKIREALGDSAESPRYIETLAKRGYRFIAPVQVVSRSTLLTSTAPDPTLDSIADSTQEPSPQSAALSPPAELVLVAPEESPVAEELPQLHRGALHRYRYVALPTGILLCFLLGWTARRVLAPDRAAPIRLDQVTSDGTISPGPPNAETFPELIAGDNRVFTSVLIGGKPELASIAMNSGEVSRIPVPQELVSAAPVGISKEGNRLLVLSRPSSSSEQPLWVVPTDGGSAFRVGEVLAHDATWMPDGHAILYANGQDLFVASRDGSRRFASLPGRAFWLRWSPDGQLLRFTLLDPLQHTVTLWEMTPDHHTSHRLSALPEYSTFSCCGSWTEDGSAYIFQQARPNAMDLWELRQGGLQSRLQQLTNGPLHFYSPVVARDGHRVYFLGSGPPSGLQQFDPAQKEFGPAPQFLKDANRVSFSHDGKWVAWTDTDGLLWRAHAADGSEKLQLTSSEMDVFSAAWAPDASRLALMARFRGQPWNILVIGAAGGEMKQLVHEQYNVADPTWSQDGKLLAYGGEPDLMGKESGPHSIKLLDVQTGKSTLVPGSEGLFSPRWSPDGRWIAALSLDQKKIRLLNVQSGAWSDLAITSAADPVWSSDSKALFVHAFLEEQQPILRVDVPGGTLHRVADLSQMHFKGPTNDFFSGLTPANQVLVLPRVGTSDLYRLDISTPSEE